MSFSAKSPRSCDARTSSLFAAFFANPPQLFAIPQALSLLSSLSELPELFVRPPGKASVADYESWDIAVSLFTMARSPAADHKIAQPELDVRPSHDCVLPKSRTGRYENGEDRRLSSKNGRTKVVIKALERLSFKACTPEPPGAYRAGVEDLAPAGETKVPCQSRPAFFC